MHPLRPSPADIPVQKNLTGTTSRSELSRFINPQFSHPVILRSSLNTQRMVQYHYILEHPLGHSLEPKPFSCDLIYLIVYSSSLFYFYSCLTLPFNIGFATVFNLLSFSICFYIFLFFSLSFLLLSFLFSLPFLYFVILSSFLFPFLILFLILFFYFLFFFNFFSLTAIPCSPVHKGDTPILSSPSPLHWMFAAFLNLL